MLWSPSVGQHRQPEGRGPSRLPLSPAPHSRRLFPKAWSSLSGSGSSMPLSITSVVRSVPAASSAEHLPSGRSHPGFGEHVHEASPLPLARGVWLRLPGARLPLEVGRDAWASVRCTHARVSFTGCCGRPGFLAGWETKTHAGVHRPARRRRCS